MLVKIARYILLNPIGLAVATMQWIVVLFAMFGDNPEPRFGFNLHRSHTFLWDYLIWLNLPALWLNYLISTPIISVFQIYRWSSLVYSVVGIVCVTLQWLSLGAGLQFIVSTHNNANRESLNIGGTDSVQ